MTRRVIYLFSLLALVHAGFCLLCAQQQTPCIALLSELRGAVFVKAEGEKEFRKAPWGTQLRAGDIVQTSSEGSASILLSNNVLLNIGPGSNITISDEMSRGKDDPQPLSKVNAYNAVDLSNLIVRTTGNGKGIALAGLRGANPDSSLLQISPRNTTIRSTTPAFAWHCGFQAERFKITVYDARGRLWEAVTSDTTIVYPKDTKRLNNGEKYSWMVEGTVGVKKFRSPRMRFDVLSRKNVDVLENKERRIQESLSSDSVGTTRYFVLGRLYRQYGLLQESVEQFEAIANHNPDSPTVYQVLARLYNELGFKEKAAFALEKAINLGQGL